MVFLEEGRAASWLLGALRRSAGTAAKGTDDASPHAAERAFDVADCMEKGLARELVTDFVRPLREARGLWKFTVERSKDRREYRLCCSRGEFLMFAKVSKDNHRIGFFLYDPLEEECGLHDRDRPAFTMTCNADRTEWRLVQERCDCHCSPRLSPCGCRERPELLNVLHSRQAVGAGVGYCMEVSICPRDNFDEQVLISKLPVWNEELASMVLDFKGRQVVASAKNFQLAAEEDPNRVVCQHGKIGPNTFSLDFKYPLTVVQAFALSLTTLFWV